jgi:DNA-binding winged helix-turn-helix (wHTH) protein
VAILVVERDGLAIRSVQLESTLVRIGREAGCELVLASQFVSRQHAELRAVDGRFELVDLGSRNGTLLNGRRLEANTPIALNDNDSFRIEEFSVRFVAKDDSAETLVPLRRAADELFVDTELMEVWIGERRLELRQARVLKLLAFMYVHRDRVCSEEELGNHVWSSDVDVVPGVPLFDPNSLYQLIYLARRAIEAAPRQPRYLVNIPGLGYRLLERPAPAA